MLDNEMDMIVASESPPVPPRVLIVDSEYKWRMVFSKLLNEAQVPHDAVNSADDAVDMIEAASVSMYTGVITDALSGEYPRVIEAANNAGAITVLLTRSTIMEKPLTQSGVVVLRKMDLDNKRNSRAVRAQRLSEIIALFMPNHPET